MRPVANRATHDYAGIAANSEVKAKATIKSWRDADEFLGSAESSKQLASNVSVERDLEDNLHVVLYATRIVTYYPDETFSVRNGGFNTPTTSSRVSQFTPDGYVFYHKGRKLTVNNESKTAEGKRFPVKEVK